ncbi:hypothetical protein [Tsuneonella amylolytica]|uniref:hypothetical protein n=1 Tax=Tsuneonella amylolytica TaxID=2338327 RepID=UPI0013C4CEAF|nr:hypothetical protein [Tsuneonella amylolytica]
MKVLRVALCVLAFSISPALLAQDADWQRIGEARNAAAYCVVSHAVRLDDKQTSPEIIARGAFRSCKPQVESFTAVFEAKAVKMIPTDPMGTRASEIQRQLDPILQDMQDLAMQAVLEHRVKK